MALWSGLDSHAEEINWDKLVASVIEVESHGEPSLVSPKGAIGLMQITPIVLKEFNDTPHQDGYAVGKHEKCRGLKSIQIYDKDYPLNSIVQLPCYEPQLYIPWVNKFIGTWYLRRLHEKYNCDTLEKILMAWNWGIGNCRKHNFDLKSAPSETKNFVKKVLAIYAQN